MKLIILFITLSLYQGFGKEEREIRDVLNFQVECWNEGDIECFMEGYWKSEKLMFIGSKGITYGWQQTLDNYKKRYPTRDAMGTLEFDIKVVEPISDEFWHVIGQWSLQRKEDNPSGHFTLLFRKLDDQWVIVSDHTS